MQLRPRRPSRPMLDRLRTCRRQRHDPRLHHRPPLQPHHPAGLQPLQPHPHVLCRDPEPHRQQLHVCVPEPVDPHQELPVMLRLARTMPRSPHQLPWLHDHQGATPATFRLSDPHLGCRPATPPTTSASDGLDHPLSPSLRSTWCERVVKHARGAPTHQPQAGRQPNPFHGDTSPDMGPKHGQRLRCLLALSSVPSLRHRSTTALGLGATAMRLHQPPTPRCVAFDDGVRSRCLFVLTRNEKRS